MTSSTVYHLRPYVALSTAWHDCILVLMKATSFDAIRQYSVNAVEDIHIQPV